jgi:hypothetical protein
MMIVLRYDFASVADCVFRNQTLFSFYTEIEVYGDPCAGKGEAHTPPSVEKTPIRVRLAHEKNVIGW